jgi:hypothetical protein
MIVPDGVTIHRGGRKFIGGQEIPDDFLPTVKTAPTATDKRKSPAPADEPA